MSKKEIPKLKKGDLIRIVAPAKAINENTVLFAKEKLEKKGFQVEISKHCTGRHGYFSGTIEERLSDFQKAIDDENVKAILCARGGYGCIQLLDLINWASFIRNPKWIIGFSDITVFHAKIQNLGYKSIHGTMPLDFAKNSKESFETLFNALKQKSYSISFKPGERSKPGKVKGVLTGGNLSILYSLLGTPIQVDTNNKILFIEDLSEPLYVIDRMFYALKMAGSLENIKALIVGGMTDLKDSEHTFGKDYKDIILSHFEYKKTPIVFDFPAGHISDNQSLILGEHVHLNTTKENGELFLNLDSL